eukprot:7808736-Alexandrium_andersonii.AAC.1
MQNRAPEAPREAQRLRHQAEAKPEPPIMQIQAPEGPAKRNGSCAKQRRSRSPVSYTHLTLPTICSV